MSVNVNDKGFIHSYVRTIEYQAGMALERNLVQEELNKTDDDAVYESYGIRRSYAPVVLNYSPSFWHFGSVNNHYHAARPSKQDKEDEKAKCAAIVGSIVSVVAGFLFAYTLKNCYRQHKTLTTTQEVTKQLKTTIIDPAIKTKITRLAATIHAANKVNYAKAWKYTAATLTILIGGALLAVGGFGAMPMLITAGSITTVAGIAFAAITLGWHWSDKEELKPQYEKALRLAREILTLLPGYPEGMVKLENPPAYNEEDLPPPYAPLFVEPSAPPYDPYAASAPYKG